MRQIRNLGTVWVVFLAVIGAARPLMAQEADKAALAKAAQNPVADLMSCSCCFPGRLGVLPRLNLRRCCQ